MRKLYLVERHARQEAMTAEQRHELRQNLAIPILAAMKTRLEELRPTVLPQSPLGKAVHYALAEWEPLNRYLDLPARPDAPFACRQESRNPRPRPSPLETGFLIRPYFPMVNASFIPWGLNDAYCNSSAAHQNKRGHKSFSPLKKRRD
jgi:hypothetical protein